MTAMGATSTDRVLHGVGVSPGVAAGPVLVVGEPVGEPAATSHLGPSEDVELSCERLAEHASRVGDLLEARARSVQGAARDVLIATAAMARDHVLLANAQAKVRVGRLTASRAAWEAAEDVAEKFQAMGGYMGERARDVRDVRDRLVASLEKLPGPGIPDLDRPVILVARDLAPADTATLDRAMVRAIVTVEGGPTSHMAILARSLGIPAVVAVRDVTRVLASAQEVIVDGSLGTVDIDPSREAIEQITNRARSRSARSFDGVGRTRDGHRIQLLANVATSADAHAAASAGAEGVGLLRTELCFPDDTEPSIEAQAQAYLAVLAEFPGRKVVVRTLDAGADKPIAYLTAPHEPNPALGMRGIRTARDHPDVLNRQLQAIAAAAQAADADVWVMAPMVATVAEAREFVAACHRHELGTAGVMIEVPGAALLADDILASAAFASIGTNDLTQYTMAADRLLGSLADLSTCLEPAVLRLIDGVCRAGARRRRGVGVCRRPDLGRHCVQRSLCAVRIRR